MCNRTGIPLIYRVLENNGSPSPKFETDEARTYFMTTIKIHPEFLKSDQLSDQVNSQIKISNKLLKVTSLKDVDSLLAYLKDHHYDQVDDHVNDQIKKLLIFCTSAKPKKEIRGKIRGDSAQIY